MALTLRSARVTDLPAVYRGEQDYIRRWEPAHEDAWRAQLERHLTRWVEHFERLTVATVDEKFAGYALWMPEEGGAELCTLNVSPAVRRSGVGRALLDACVQGAAAQGFACMSLSVRPDNPARLLYEQAGFACQGVGAHGYLRYERRSVTG